MSTVTKKAHPGAEKVKAEIKKIASTVKPVIKKAVAEVKPIAKRIAINSLGAILDNAFNHLQGRKNGPFAPGSDYNKLLSSVKAEIIKGVGNGTIVTDKTGADLSSHIDNTLGK